MKRSLAVKKLFFVSLLATAASAGHAQTDSTPTANVSPMPLSVLVDVDAQGHVENVQLESATRLSPEIDRLLRETLNKWIHKPAIVSGRRVASQMVVNMSLRVSPQPDGKYSANFVYISSSAASSGSTSSVSQGNLTIKGGVDPFQGTRAAPLPYVANSSH